MRCPGSVALEADEPDSSSAFADEGSAAHEVAQRAFTFNKPAAFFIGEVIRFGVTEHRPQGRAQVPVTADMARFVQIYLDAVRGRMESYRLAGAIGVSLEVEQRVPIGHITGEEDAHGTADAIILVEWADHTALIDCWDLKYGMGVEVEAKDNEQGCMYALGAVEKFSLMYDFKHVKINIHQPRIRTTPSEWELTIDDLGQFGNRATMHAEWAMACIDQGIEEAEDLVTGDKQCKFCKAKAKCPALSAQVLSIVSDGFADLDQPLKPQLASIEERVKSSDNTHLANCLSVVDLIEGWCKAVRAKTEAELLQGRAVPGYKLVQGRQGARAWTDETEAEAMLKTFRLKHDQLYQYKVISPTTAEKLATAGDIGQRQWPKLQALITRSDGKPSVAPESDKRPALVVTPVAEEFEALPETALV